MQVWQGEVTGGNQSAPIHFINESSGRTRAMYRRMTQTTPKPQALPVQADSIPIELRERPQWCGWNYQYRPDKSANKPWTKPPFQVNGSYAKSNDPSTWTSFDVVVRQLDRFDGIGFMFSEDDSYIGVDIDHCRNPLDGTIEPRAQDIIKRFDSYTEVSASGTGVHLLVKGELPPGGRKRGEFEIYKLGRYFTMTGHHLEGTPLEIHERQAEITAIHREWFGQKKEPGPESTAQNSAGDSWTDDWGIIYLKRG
jgi:putative DNA primase/helicase